MTEREHVKRIHGFIRQWITKNINETAADYIRIIYAGQINKKLASDLITLDDVDGFLVNSLTSITDDFSQIV